ncbi:SPFH domain-containing protein [Aquimarina sp. BL5]|uniref:SPFH domain-containing protein n=1 Tax=Aquimarina sp. BL5 TaxID=1714860 RepID=UPI000E4A42CA|nr:SPFH domain-containing protein [Aquimarina sp. BL5]AXT50762.1 SPFH domain-containing protein [Aquimarina sp. BL5]RKN08215.1 SPFH domain-containing protein [Aquimarina sp. BL5]
MKKEKSLKASNGYLMILILLLVIGGTIFGFAISKNPLFLISIFAIILLIKGFFIVNPNSSKVMVLFGAYKGTVKENGFFWANPFYTKQRISLRARNFYSERVKVNDKIGNPILINVILVWKVSDTYKAAFDVDHYEDFVRVQTDAAVRKLAGSYPYDNFAEGEVEVTLLSGMDEVNEALENEITERLLMAGIEVMEARIGYLAYAPEIASSMLKRQQAVAIVAARKKIVEGAVGMVEDALIQLSEDKIIDFDDDKKASMVSNLMVVLCGDKEATPVINTGTLHS